LPTDVEYPTTLSRVPLSPQPNTRGGRRPKEPKKREGTRDINGFENSAMVVTYNGAGLKNDMFNDTETRGGPSRQTRTDVVILFGPLRKHHGAKS